jgi:hypothetical protein
MLKKSCYALLFTGFWMFISSIPAGAASIWTSIPITFTNVDFADPTLEANQDRITDNVWITRGAKQGIYNAVTEASYTSFLSPADTEWADGAATDWETLTFVAWENWASIVHSGPPSTIGVAAVLHLITDDVYIDITFDSWTSGPGDPNSDPGGGFSYTRTTGLITPVPVPAAVYLFTSGLVGLLAIARRKRRASNLTLTPG